MLEKPIGSDSESAEEIISTIGQWIDEDRVFRLKSEFAWSQQPRSRTTRIVSNIAVFAAEDPAVLMVRSSFMVTEFQAGDFRTYTGWSGHKLRETRASFEILVKQVNLIDCDQNLRNPSIIL